MVDHTEGGGILFEVHRVTCDEAAWADEGDEGGDGEGFDKKQASEAGLEPEGGVSYNEGVVTGGGRVSEKVLLFDIGVFRVCIEGVVGDRGREGGDEGSCSCAGFDEEVG